MVGNCKREVMAQLGSVMVVHGGTTAAGDVCSDLHVINLRMAHLSEAKIAESFPEATAQ
jgi:hypothetical protein